MTSSVDDLVAGRRGSTVVFVVTTFGLTWLVWTPLAIAALGAPELPQVPLIFFAGSFGPLAGALAASAYSGGWRGVRSWAGRTFSLRFRGVWWNVAAVATVWVLTFGLGEEAGWRGWLLPHLARRFSTFWAALIVAGVWIVWHAPAFVFNPTYREMGPGIVGWMLALVAGSYLLAWLARGARWSIVPVLIWHGGFDLLTASDQAAGTIAAVISAIVMVQGVIAAGVLWRSRNLERGGATGPRPSVSSGPGR